MERLYLELSLKYKGMHIYIWKPLVWLSEMELILESRKLEGLWD